MRTDIGEWNALEYDRRHPPSKQVIEYEGTHEFPEDFE